MLASLLRFPIPAPALTDETVAQFAGADGTFKGKPPPVLPSSKKEGAAHSLANQVHINLRHTLRFRDRKPVWDAHVFDVLGNATIDRLSPPAYPHAASDIKYAIETMRRMHGFESCGRQRRLCLVVSSITPWVETMLLKSQTCATVHVLDFNPAILEDGRFGDRLRTFAPKDVPALDGGGYDLVVSFSGIEHSGLTRYGDMPDPQGDVRAGAELAAKLKRNGCGFLGLPLAAATDIVWPQHRMYGRPRFRDVIRAFAEPLGFVWNGRVLADPFDPESISNARSSVADWQYQPVAMLTTTSSGWDRRSGSAPV